MKFLDYLFHGKELRYIDSYFKMLNGYSPTFTSYNGGVYEMDLTRTAVNSFATHCSKLKPEIEGNNAADTYAKRGNYKRCQKFCKYPLSGKGGKYTETRGHKERATAFYRG